MQKNTLSYCGDLVRRHDPDRFLISMFLPADIREDLWTLFAFNYEISKTREVVSDTTLGLIRLQWWRDSIAGIYDGGYIPAHEILKPLAGVIERHALPREHFDTLIYAREFDLEDVAPANIEGLINYADFTTTPLFSLAVQICGDDPAQTVIQPIAINYTLAGVLRSTLFYARQCRCYLPDAIMERHSVTKDDVFNGTQQDGLTLVLREVAGARLSVTRPTSTFLRGCEALSELYFKQMALCDCDTMSHKFNGKMPLKAFFLFWKIKLLSF